MKTFGHFAKQSVRDAAVAGLLAIVFLTTGSCEPPGIASLIAAVPFDLDVSLRALAQDWYPTERTLPVTIVDIDEKTHGLWGGPPTTPRADLARLIGTVAAAGPRAVVVDIDLSWGATLHADTGRAVFRRFLESYQHSAPLVFPKRVARDSLQHDMAVPSDVDDLIGAHPKLIWAHANFSAGRGGAVRDWEEWVDICVGQITRRLPAVPTVIIGHDSSPSVTNGVAPGQCGASHPPMTHRLFLGPRMTGPTRIPTPKVQAISAATLLAPGVARDDAALFTDRIVLIGATHQDAGDLWLTPRGIVPGVELLASIIHYSPLTFGDGVASTPRLRIATVVVFLALALGSWRLTGIATVAAVILGMLIAMGLAVGVFEWFWFFDAVAAALTLLLGYEATRAVIELALRVHEEMHPKVPPAPASEASEPRREESTKRGFFTAVARACVRKELIEGGARG